MGLKISELFYSVQAEGTSTGIPSIFIRLQGCNLMCGGPGGSLMKEGKATWWCDTEAVWKLGKEYSNEDLYNEFKEMGQIDNIRTHRTRLIWTGGEPTMPRHVDAIAEFIDFIRKEHDIYPYSEIETNGTIPIKDNGLQFYHRESNAEYSPTNTTTPYIQQINCSPKLSNSGLSESMRINKSTIEQIKQHYSGNYQFKFVISTEDDVHELEETFIKPFNIHWDKVVLMPGLDKQEDAAERTRFVYDMAKKFGYRAVTRGHVIAWDQLTGV